MKTHPECIPCFLKHTVEASRLATRDEALQEDVIRQVLALLSRVRFEESPPLVTARIHRIIRSITGESDPYNGFKKAFNQAALDLYPELKARVEASDRPLRTAVQLAIAGNAIDCILGGEFDSARIDESVENSLSSSLDSDLLSEFESRLGSAERILYIADNAGELVLDRLLLERIPSEKTTLVVRGSPILNDATMEDVALAEIPTEVRVIDTGSDVPGVVPGECSGSFREHFGRADIVIAKGQGNYETLSQSDGSIFFLFKVKCPVVARETGWDVGRAIMHGTDRHMKGGE
jgi:uncharacterized protein with ATP-grasp and redox domains